MTVVMLMPSISVLSMMQCPEITVVVETVMVSMMNQVVAVRNSVFPMIGVFSIMFVMMDQAVVLGVTAMVS